MIYLDKKVHIAGVIPGVQQVVGIGAVLYGLIGVVANTVQLIFRGIQKQIIKHKLDAIEQKPVANRDEADSRNWVLLSDRLNILDDNLNVFLLPQEGSIQESRDAINYCAKYIGYGLLTALPVAGTISNAVYCYKKSR